MEKDANYFTIGVFVTVTMLALVGFAIWLAGSHDFSARERYTVYFTDPLGGLEEEAMVKYKGVEVGKVVDMRLAPERSDLIKVDIEVRADTPVRAGTVATIAMQGITGFSYLDLATDSTDKAPPRRVSGEKYAVLTGTGSPLAKFLDEMPKVSAEFKATLSAVGAFTKESTETAGSIRELSEEGTKTVTSIRELTDKLKDDPSQIISPPSYEDGVKIPR
jgi:phospholipid/cholesterol/gamma-HCH transport system substrate-binding protein